MHVYLFDATGKFVSHTTCDHPPTKEELETLNSGMVASLVETPWHTGDDPSGLVATIVDGAVTAAAVPEELVAWLHISLDGGTVAPTGTRYVERGQTLTVSGELREGQSPTSRLMEELTGGPWGIEMVHELGIDLLSPLVAVSAGVISGSWTMPSDARDGLYALSDARLGSFGAYRVKQADPSAAEFKVVRSM